MIFDKMEVGQTKDDSGNGSLKEFREATRRLDDLYSFFPKKFGLSEPEFWSLLLIYDGVVTQSKISQQLFLSRQTLNSAFKQLVKKGLIRLEIYENNQRSKRALLTQEGQELVEKLAKYMHHIEDQAWGKLDEQDQKMLACLTQKYAMALDGILSRKDRGFGTNTLDRTTDDLDTDN